MRRTRGSIARIVRSARPTCLLAWRFVSTLPTVAVSALGVALIALAGRDVFDALFHPEGRGTLGRLIMRTVWAAFRRLAIQRRGAFALAGPTALLVVISSWAALLILGWALIFWPHIGRELHALTAVHPGTFVEALHTSLVTITTLGFADVIPHAGWLRVVAPLEALLGFGLLSASISWLLLIYPAISRRRSLAYEVSLLVEAEGQTGVALERLEPASAAGIYAELTSRLVEVSGRRRQGAARVDKRGPVRRIRETWHHGGWHAPVDLGWKIHAPQVAGCVPSGARLSPTAPRAATSRC